MPYKIASGPIARIDGMGPGTASHGKTPKPFKIESGSFADRSRIQPKKGSWRKSILIKTAL